MDALNANGMAARFINSSLTTPEVEQVQEQIRRGHVKILYAARSGWPCPGSAVSSTAWN